MVMVIVKIYGHSPKTGERFFFDYGGKERDVLNLVQDEKAD